MARWKRDSETVTVDDRVGARIREYRRTLGFTQQQLADIIGTSYQQMHKYEHGINRVSAGRLFEIAQVLGVSVDRFYEGIDSQGPKPATSPRQRMLLEVARNFSEIENEEHKEAVSALVRALAGP